MASRRRRSTSSTAVANTVDVLSARPGRTHEALGPARRRRWGKLDLHTRIPRRLRRRRRGGTGRWRANRRPGVIASWATRSIGCGKASRRACSSMRWMPSMRNARFVAAIAVAGVADRIGARWLEGACGSGGSDPGHRRRPQQRSVTGMWPTRSSSQRSSTSNSVIAGFFCGLPAAVQRMVDGERGSAASPGPRQTVDDIAAHQRLAQRGRGITVEGQQQATAGGAVQAVDQVQGPSNCARRRSAAKSQSRRAPTGCRGPSARPACRPPRTPARGAAPTPGRAKGLRAFRSSPRQAITAPGRRARRSRSTPARAQLWAADLQQGCAPRRRDQQADAEARAAPRSGAVASPEAMPRFPRRR